MTEKNVITDLIGICDWLSNNMWKLVSITMGGKTDIFRILGEADDIIPSWNVLKQGETTPTQIDGDRIDRIEIEDEEAQK